MIKKSNFFSGQRNRPILSVRQDQLHSTSGSIDDVNRKNKSKNLLTDLFVAASIGDAPGVDYFLRVQGLAVDASDGRGWKPIHHASLHGQAKVVELLIRRGANVNCKTISGLTPISLAGSCLTPRYETISLLLANKADPNVASPAGVTPLMDVCGRAYEPETEKLCNLLLMNEAKATATDIKGRDATETSLSE